ncbi:MAG: hypothetical protein CVV27_00635 [Candidatus Melainabacteria bacterium HGW-Melainabacteria-1]|nr:MAG: hypothetical protein CVV27_00635 [Candidatus Melainabacteria bacterium HGW-Melainabacteria-1]
MFTFQWSGVNLALAAGAALLCEFWITWLLHLRYDRQFGWSFIISGLVTFSLPAFSSIGVTVYLILESGMELLDQLLMLTALALCCLWSGWRLKQRLLGRIFYQKSGSKGQLSDSAAAESPSS